MRIDIPDERLERRYGAERMIRTSRGQGDLSRVGRRSTVVAALLAAVAPITVGMMNAQAMWAQTLQAAPQTAPSGIPGFEVVSVKACKDDVAAGTRTGGGNSSPGRLNIMCQTVKGLINIAYVLFANGRTFNFGSEVPIEGGPAWIDSDRYTIEATSKIPQKSELMQGPMLQALLEDRFKLKIHHETREAPVYALTVARGGPKLKPFKEGSCVPIDFLSLSKSELAALSPDVNYCRNRGTMKGGTVTMDAFATSLDDFSKKTLNGSVDRPIINKTAIQGLFDIHLEYVPDGTSAMVRRDGDDPGSPVGPSIFTALQEQLGLKLEPAKGSGELLMIDHVEKPSAN